MAGFDIEPERHARDIAGALITACTRIHEEEPHPVVPIHLRDMGMAAYEYIWMVHADEFLRKQVVQRPLRVISPVATRPEADVGHQHSQPLAFEMGVSRIYLPDIKPVAVAIYSHQGLESLYRGSTCQGSEVPRMPDLVHWLEELPDIRGKSPVRV